ncbi:helix-turn-helix domain-containing protein [Streptomyces ferrugineus]|uniref:Helix-turn-helix domain-containing protein n=1 Tax=Streptomyces ferrugineus TaxID=1413221 RepID=A0A7M2SAM5_9ACTN|nr:helix-turn-helix transcriptional regulator [Streptomyces ferrugineus]QOV33427.1 helix-turn-helix domain-containing protein [Streptomyces ferrugineus]
MSEGTAAADFAALLRQLKDRSGLSYGVLGKRLHMSTSTLHRYCNGDAVPTDYAPVERLARLCKAAPEELVELHRRWVLADALRGRKGAGEAAASASQDAGAAGQGDADAGAAGQGDAQVPSEETAVGPGAPVAEFAPADTPGPARPTIPAGRPRRLRRRTAVLAGVGVAVVLGAVALALTLPSGGHQGDDGRGSPVGAAASKDASAQPTKDGPRTSASPSKNAEPGGPDSPSPSATATKSAPGAGAGSADRPDAKPPLTVNTRPYSWEGPCSQHYLVDRPATEVGPPPVEQDAPAWVGAYKAVSAGQQLVTLTVQGTGRETVVLDSLKVRVVARDTPLAWNDYVMGVGCGGDVPTRPFSVALDGARPTVVAGAGQRDFPLKVSESDPEVLKITADASAYDVSWYLELAWSSGDRHGTLVVKDNGKPFRTSGNNGRPAYEFPLGGQKWLESAEG